MEYGWDKSFNFPVAVTNRRRRRRCGSCYMGACTTVDFVPCWGGFDLSDLVYSLLHRITFLLHSNVFTLLFPRQLKGCSLWRWFAAFSGWLCLAVQFSLSTCPATHLPGPEMEGKLFFCVARRISTILEHTRKPIHPPTYLRVKRSLLDWKALNCFLIIVRLVDFVPFGWNFGCDWSFEVGDNYILFKFTAACTPEKENWTVIALLFARTRLTGYDLHAWRLDGSGGWLFSVQFS